MVQQFGIDPKSEPSERGFDIPSHTQMLASSMAAEYTKYSLNARCDVPR